MVHLVLNFNGYIHRREKGSSEKPLAIPGLETETVSRRFQVKREHSKHKVDGHRSQTRKREWNVMKSQPRFALTSPSDTEAQNTYLCDTSQFHTEFTESRILRRLDIVVKRLVLGLGQKKIRVARTFSISSVLAFSTTTGNSMISLG